MVGVVRLALGVGALKRPPLLCGLGNLRRKGETWSGIEDGGIEEEGKGTGQPVCLGDRTTEKGYQRADVRS